MTGTVNPSRRSAPRGNPLLNPGGVARKRRGGRLSFTRRDVAQSYREAALLPSTQLIGCMTKNSCNLQCR